MGFLAFGNNHANVVFGLKSVFHEWTSEFHFDSMLFANVEFAKWILNHFEDG